MNLTYMNNLIDVPSNIRALVLWTETAVKLIAGDYNLACFEIFKPTCRENSTKFVHITKTIAETKLFFVLIRVMDHSFRYRI